MDIRNGCRVAVDEYTAICAKACKSAHDARPGQTFLEERSNRLDCSNHPLGRLGKIDINSVFFNQLVAIEVGRVDSKNL